MTVIRTPNDRSLDRARICNNMSFQSLLAWTVTYRNIGESNATLRYHQRAHTGEKPYSCGLCAARFVSREHWRLHQRVHSGERPYCCGVCGLRFAQKPALNRHYI
ncbi:jg24638, partial [Pararge aegeria aegeria]